MSPLGPTFSNDPFRPPGSHRAGRRADHGHSRAAEGRSPAGARAPAAAPGVPAPAVPAESAAGAGSWLLPLAVLVVGMFMSVLDTSIVNVALPTVQIDLGISANDGQWVSTAYSLTEGIMVPISAWLGYRFGSKKIYLFCLAGFTLASALCGLAGGLGTLVAFRILQAIPGGVIPVTCMTMLRRMVPPERLGAAMGLYGLGIIVAPALGPTLGGVLVEYVDWRFIFFVNVPVGVLGLVAAVAVLKDTPGRRDKPLDVLGFASIAGGLFALLLALEEGKDWGWTSYRILILFTAAVLLIALFVVVELEVDTPLLDLRVFRSGQFVLALVLGAAVSLGMFASAFFVPQFLQGASRGLTPVNTGLALIPQALVLAVFLPMTGVLFDRFGARWLAVLGLTLSGTGLMMLSRINVDIPTDSLILGEVALAAGVGLGVDCRSCPAALAAVPHGIGRHGKLVQHAEPAGEPVAGARHPQRLPRQPPARRSWPTGRGSGRVREHRPAGRGDAGAGPDGAAGALPAGQRLRPDRRLQPGVLRDRPDLLRRSGARAVPALGEAHAGLVPRGGALTRPGRPRRQPTRSKTAARPWPPPMHMVSRP